MAPRFLAYCADGRFLDCGTYEAAVQALAAVEGLTPAETAELRVRGRVAPGDGPVLLVEKAAE